MEENIKASFTVYVLVERNVFLHDHPAPVTVYLWKGVYDEEDEFQSLQDITDQVKIAGPIPASDGLHLANELVGFMKALGFQSEIIEYYDA